MTSHQAPRVSKPNESAFFKRLGDLASESDSVTLKNLATATQTLMASAAEISKQITRFLPQFTLHDDVHLWNVLSFMEELAGGKEGIGKLEAGDCAMAIWAAFIHDLGMVLEAGELAVLDAADQYDSGVAADQNPANARAEAWRAYRDGHPHWNTIRKAPEFDENRMRLGVIRAAFIRDSHAQDDAHSEHCRIGDWLGLLSESHKLIAEAVSDYAISNRVIRVAVSHNQDIGWLPRQLGEKLGLSEPQAEASGPELGTIHWTWIGWLLRLADVFDCDKSRTPQVLFDHSGITDPRSKTEWQKHLAIRDAPEWEMGADGETLSFTCHICPAPVVEKAIHQIIGWMNDEIGNVRAAKLATPYHESLPELRLPSKTEIDIKRRKDDYLYHDMLFRLDRDAVVELLMGESLYGGPELALRELVQNALDAVHLRDQRNKLARALITAGGSERPSQPSQSWDSQKEEVRVSWGEEEGKQFIRVEDSGVGMTVGAMRRFLTEIGRSYYKSNDFRTEQEQMRRNGILCTAISQFGIGFLSVFMLADEVTIYTRPVGVTDENPPTDSAEQEMARFPFRAEISGPHGLLTFYPDKQKRLPGTSVTLKLKKEIVLQDWDRSRLIAQLRHEFYECDIPTEVEASLKTQRETVAKGQKLLDPAFEISRFIVWPLYPVNLSAADAAEPLVIDDSFHHRELVPLDRQALQSKASEWGHQVPEIEETDWRVCDWTDEHQSENGMQGTGSRIRLIGPQPKPDTGPFTPSGWTSLSEYLPSGQPRLLLGSFCEPQLPKPLTRYQCLVNGVRIVPGYVPSGSERDCKLPSIIEQIPMLPGAGGWVWIDLRGEAMPRLRADRSAPVSTQPDPSAWRGVMQRWNDARESGFAPAWLRSQVLCSEYFRSHLLLDAENFRLGLRHIMPLLIGGLCRIEASITINFRGGLPGDQSRKVLSALALAPAPALALALARARGRGLDLGLDLDLALDLDLDLALARARALDRARDRDLALDRDRDRDRELHSILAKAGWRGELLASGIRDHFASEALDRKSADSHPAMGMAGQLEDMKLVGPLRVAKATDESTLPKWLNAYGLTFPYTVFPLDALRSRFPSWFNDVRCIYVLPFLFGAEPGASWRERLKKQRPFDSLLLFLPNPDHWEHKFTDLSRDEWSAGSASALWNLKTGKVLYADGIHTSASIRKKGVGKSLDNWLKQ